MLVLLRTTKHKESIKGVAFFRRERKFQDDATFSKFCNICIYKALCLSHFCLSSEGQTNTCGNHHFSMRQGGQTSLEIGDGGGAKDVDGEEDMSKVNIIVSPEILVYS